MYMPRVVAIERFACPKCDAMLGTGSAECPNCGGENLTERPPASPDFVVAAPSRWAWIHDRRTMLFVLLAGIGALGLPLLWASRAFRVPGKIGWSIVVTIETALLCWACWASVESSLDAFRLLAR
jgi:hypothetical protein